MAECRQKLMHEGKAYPRSSCAVCGIFAPRWRECDAQWGDPKAWHAEQLKRAQAEARAFEIVKSDPLAALEALEGFMNQSNPFMWAYQEVDTDKWRTFEHQLKRYDGSICPGVALYRKNK